MPTRLGKPSRSWSASSASLPPPFCQLGNSAGRPETSGGQPTHSLPFLLIEASSLSGLNENSAEIQRSIVEGQKAAKLSLPLSISHHELWRKVPGIRPAPFPTRHRSGYRH